MSNYNNNKVISIGNDNNGVVNNNRNKIEQNQNNINKTEIINLLPQRKSQEEIEQEMKRTMRPCLRDNVGKQKTCFGFVVDKYDKLGSDYYTVINVVDRDGNYLADHIQLNFKEDLYHYDYEVNGGHYIRFTGNVIEYTRSDGTRDYNININDKVCLLPSSYYCDLLFDDNDVDFDKIRDYLSNCNISKINDLIDNLRNELNELTKYYYIDDFIYYYIINQLFLNTATYKIYEGDIRDYNINDSLKITLLCILGSIVYELKTTQKIYMFDLFSYICEHCNILQGVDNYTDVNQNPEFIKFCMNHMNCKGKKKLGKLFNFVRQRYRDFKELKTRPTNLNKQEVIERCYYVLINYIK